MGANAIGEDISDVEKKQNEETNIGRVGENTSSEQKMNMFELIAAELKKNNLVIITGNAFFDYTEINICRRSRCGQNNINT